MKEINAVHILLAFVVLFLVGIALLVSIHATHMVARMQLEEQHDFDDYIFINPDGSVINTRYLEQLLMENNTVVQVVC